MVHSVDGSSADTYQLASSTLFLKRVKNFEKVMYRGCLLDQIQSLVGCHVRFIILFYITGEEHMPKYLLIRGTLLYTCIGLYIGLYIGISKSEVY